jgi:hypothetical protein
MSCFRIGSSLLLIVSLPTFEGQTSCVEVKIDARYQREQETYLDQVLHCFTDGKHWFGQVWHRISIFTIFMQDHESGHLQD